MSAVLRIKDVEERTGFSRASIYRKISLGLFPKPIHICDGRASAWFEHEVDAVIDAAKAKRAAAAKRSAK
jgi:prophage regulatory protein